MHKWLIRKAKRNGLPIFTPWLPSAIHFKKSAITNGLGVWCSKPNFWCCHRDGRARSFAPFRPYLASTQSARPYLNVITKTGRHAKKLNHNSIKAKWLVRVWRAVTHKDRCSHDYIVVVFTWVRRLYYRMWGAWDYPEGEREWCLSDGRPAASNTEAVRLQSAHNGDVGTGNFGVNCWSWPTRAKILNYCAINRIFNFQLLIKYIIEW